MKKYDPKHLEPKWQQIWSDTKLYAAVTGDHTRPKYYMLTEFPYPSGAGLHAGHAREYTLGDVMARHKRMQGYNVLYPMGYDAFGLPTENYAIKHKVAPQVATADNIAIFRQQFNALGFSFDWDREINTTDPSYYKWTQWLFLKFLEAGLAYQAEMAINWCPKEKTGLANEEVVDGKHERCGTPVEKKLIKQWMLGITAYADRLIEGLKTVDYPPRIADQQVNWIGRSEGAEITWPVADEAAPEANYLILHGYTGHADSDFLPWLVDSLEQDGVRVTAPELPGTDRPDAKQQAEAAMKAHSIDANTVIVGHSYGAVTALRIVEQLNTPIRRIVLAAGFAQPGFSDRERVFEATTDWDFDFERIRRNVREVIILRDTTDPAVPAARADYLQQKLGGRIVDFVAESPHVLGKMEPVVLHHTRPSLTVYTTRKDTIPGVTFIVVAPESPLLDALTAESEATKVKQYRDAVAGIPDLERQGNKTKTGCFTGKYALNPFNGQAVPIYVADYVLASYGTGVVMGMPGHDQRDREFAREHKLPVIYTTQLPADFPADDPSKVYNGRGQQINTGPGYDGLSNREASAKIFDTLKEKGLAKAKINYKLRDWIFSRQHYWGEPIPVVHCATDGVVPVPENELPVKLPAVDKYEPTDTGESPLAAITDWVNVECPKCGGPAKRETDTMPNWAGSNWYYLRYMDARNDQRFADPEAMKYWGMADLYLGGMEHTTLHLLYSRFVHQFLYNQGLVPTPEPYAARRGQGIVLASDGRKMSKSIGNVVNPTDIIATHGADTLRLYILFMAPYDETTPWSEERLNGASRFVYKVWNLAHELIDAHRHTHEVSMGAGSGTFETEVDRATHKAIKKIHDDLHDMHFNTAVSTLMEYVNFLSDARTKAKLLEPVSAALASRTLRTLLLLMAPITPHMSEELWHDIGEEGSVHVAGWPKYDPELIKDEVVTIVVQVNGKVRANLALAADAPDEELVAAAQADPKVAKFLAPGIVKTIVIPRKLVNFVVK